MDAGDRNLGGPHPGRGPTPVTWLLVLSWIGLHVLALVLSGSITRPGVPAWQVGAPDGEVLIRLGAERPALVRLGEWQRLLTHAFLHGFFLHLLLNAFVFLSLGRTFERLCGCARTWIVFVLAAIVGGVAHLLQGGDAIGVGASGGLLGVAGALLVVAFGSSNEQVAALRGRLVFFLVLMGVLSFLPGVGLAAHVGGLLGGILVMLVLGPRRGTGPAGRWTRRAAIVLLLVAFGAGAVQAFDAPGGSSPEIRRFLADLRVAENLGRRLYERPDLAKPAARVELSRRLDALGDGAPLDDAEDREALLAYLHAWRPVATGDVPDPFAFEAALERARDGWRPVAARLRIRSGASRSR